MTIRAQLIEDFSKPGEMHPIRVSVGKYQVWEEGNALASYLTVADARELIAQLTAAITAQASERNQSGIR